MIELFNAPGLSAEMGSAATVRTGPELCANNFEKAVGRRSPKLGLDWIGLLRHRLEISLCANTTRAAICLGLDCLTGSLTDRIVKKQETKQTQLYGTGQTTTKRNADIRHVSRQTPDPVVSVRIPSKTSLYLLTYQPACHYRSLETT